MRKTKILIRILSLLFAMMFCGVTLAEEPSAIASEPEAVASFNANEGVDTTPSSSEPTSDVITTSSQEVETETVVNDTSVAESKQETSNENEDVLTPMDSAAIEELTSNENSESDAEKTDSDAAPLLSEAVQSSVEESIENSEVSTTANATDTIASASIDTSSSVSTTSSLYTVDFTANGTTYSIAGDSKKVKLSTILNNIDIAGDIADVKVFMDEDCTEDAENGVVAVDGKTLFNVYKDDDGEWYVDSSNAFSSVHGLKVLLPDNKEYKIKVTDDLTPVKYIDENGAEQTVSTYSIVDSNTTTWTSGWYVVNSNVNFNDCGVNVSGDVNLILMDGFKMFAGGSEINSGVKVFSGNSLTIYGQENGSGTLSAYGNANTLSNKWQAGIGGYGKGNLTYDNGGTITINGGTVFASGGSIGKAILASSVTINNYTDIKVKNDYESKQEAEIIASATDITSSYTNYSDISGKKFVYIKAVPTAQPSQTNNGTTSTATPTPTNNGTASTATPTPTNNGTTSTATPGASTTPVPNSKNDDSVTTGSTSTDTNKGTKKDEELIEDKDKITTTLTDTEGIKIDVVVDEDKVSTSIITKDKIKESINDENSNGMVLIDVSKVSDQVNRIELSKESIKNIADSDATGLKTVMTIGSMTLNKVAVTKVADVTNEEGLILVVEEISEDDLSKVQQDTINTERKDNKVVAVIDSYILSAKNKIKNLNGGKATLEINSEALNISDALAKILIIYEVGEDGTLTKIDYEFIDGQIVFDAKILATYMFVKE